MKNGRGRSFVAALNPRLYFFHRIIIGGVCQQYCSASRISASVRPEETHLTTRLPARPDLTGGTQQNHARDCCNMCTFTPTQQRKLGLSGAPHEISGRRGLVYQRLQRRRLVATEGSFGCVYPYQYKGILLAVKWFFHNGRSSEDVYQHELALAYKAMTIKSEFVVQLIDYNDRQRWLAMEWCSRGEIYHYIKSEPFPEDIALYYTWQGAQALADLHKASIFHLDYKTDNLLLTSDYQLKLCDFSCSISGQQFSDIDVLQKYFSHIRPKMQHGAPECRVPAYNRRVRACTPEEQIHLLGCADVWSLGMAILTMLTSSYVFSTPMGTPNLVLFSLLQRRQFDEFWAEVDAYLQRNQRSLSISASTKELLQRMLSIDPFERPLASEVALVLQDLPQPKDVEVFMQQRRLDL